QILPVHLRQLFHVPGGRVEASQIVNVVAFIGHEEDGVVVEKLRRARGVGLVAPPQRDAPAVFVQVQEMNGVRIRLPGGERLARRRNARQNRRSARAFVQQRL